MSGRFVKGQSGNPGGRPKARRPHNSAFDIIFDKMLTVRQGDVEREITIDEALEMQTYHAALKGNRPAIRAVLKMIEKREQALRRASPPTQREVKPLKFTYSTESADEAMFLLNIICTNPEMPGADSPRPRVVETWAAQAAISRRGGSGLKKNKKDGIQLFVRDFSTLRWPRG